MSDFYENLLRATDNTKDITVEKYGVITKLEGLYCSVKETDNGLEHNNVPIVNGTNLSVGDKVIIGFLNNSIYDVVCYGSLDKAVHDDSKQDLLISGTNIKTINHQAILGSGNINIEGGSNVDVVTSWEATLSDTKVPSEKLTKNTLDNKVDKVTGKGLSTNDFTNSYKNTIDGLSTVATTGDYDDLLDKPSIPSSSSDLSDGSDLVKKSSTSGLLKNDGSVDTNSYLTSSSLSNYVQKSSTTGLLKNDGTVDTSAYITSSAITGKEDASNKVTSWSSTVNDTHYPSEKLVSDSLATKQATLVSGTNIKTVNNESLLGSGNITIQGGGGSGGSYINDYYWDSTNDELVLDYTTGVSQADIVTSWSSTVSDTNVPSEKLTKNSLDGKANSTHNHNYSDLNNVSTVTITVTYSNNTSENITLLKYTGS